MTHEPSSFPANHADIGVSDPAVQRAHDAGELPPDYPDEDGFGDDEEARWRHEDAIDEEDIAVPPEPVSTLGVELVHATVAIRCARMDFRFVLDVLDDRGGSVMRTKLARISEYLDDAAEAIDKATDHYKRSQ
jgi:hypothetical protein